MNLSSWSQPDMAGGLAQAKSNRWARVREMAVLMITSGWMESSVQLWYGALGAVGTRTFVRYHVRSGRGGGQKKKKKCTGAEVEKNVSLGRLPSCQTAGA